MESERLYRLSIPGIVFLSSLILFYLKDGGDSSFIQHLTNESNITLFVGIVITVPALGLIISSFTQFIVVIWGYKFYHPVIIDKTYNKILGTKDKKFILKKGICNRRRSRKEFYWLYQAYVRQNLKEETIKFLQRRWNFFWIHANNIITILSSFLLSLGLDKGNKETNINSQVLNSLIFLLIAYIISAFFHAMSIYWDVIKIEEESVLQATEKKSEKIS